MKKSDFIKAVAERGDFTQKSVKAILDVMQSVAYEAVKDDEVPIFNGLTIYTTVRDARVGRNPRTGESVDIPEKRVPKAKIGRAFKNAVAL